MEMILKDTYQKINDDVVCTFETENKKNCIVLTDNSRNEQGLLNINAYYYEKVDNKLYLEPINMSDLYLVEEAINKLKGENN